MTDKVLNDYYFKNRDKFKSLSRCSCVSELLLKQTIYGQHWSEWDWMLLMMCVFIGDAVDAHNQSLYNDVIETVDSNDLLDGILTKKNIVLSMIYGINSCHLHLGTLFVQRRIAILLAHVFKKFPELWKMSWMFAKFKDNTTKKWTKYHRLGAYLSDISKQYSYTHPNECYDKFIETYFKNS